MFNSNVQPAEVSAFIDSERSRFGVEPICEALGVSASAYDERASGRRSPRAVEDERLYASAEGMQGSPTGNGDRADPLLEADIRLPTSSIVSRQSATRSGGVFAFVSFDCGEAFPAASTAWTL
jgi:hypothetical protein